jgi:hypothetical protein
MPDITRSESYAMQDAAQAAGHNETSEERRAFRNGWLAGREYERSRQPQPNAQPLVAGGMRLLGCSHTASCRSVHECARRAPA